MRSLQLPKSSCPWCGQEVDYCSTPSGLNSPSKGDLSICAHCAGLVRFDTKLTLQKLDEEALRQLAVDSPEAYASLIEIRTLILQSKEGSDAP